MKINHRKLLICIMFLFCSCFREKLDPSIKIDDFEWPKFIEFIKEDISHQINCDCINFIFENEFHDEQRFLLVLGGFGEFLNKKNESMNPISKKFDFIYPPEEIFKDDEKNNCADVSWSRVVISSDQSLLYTELKVVETKERYFIFLTRFNEKKWSIEASGVLNEPVCN